MPRCAIEQVAPTLSLQMYGGCQDSTLNSVLQAEPDPAHLVADGAAGLHRQPSSPQHRQRKPSDGVSHAGCALPPLIASP